MRIHEWHPTDIFLYSSGELLQSSLSYSKETGGTSWIVMVMLSVAALSLDAAFLVAWRCCVHCVCRMRRRSTQRALLITVQILSLAKVREKNDDVLSSCLRIRPDRSHCFCSVTPVLCLQPCMSERFHQL